MDPFVPSAAVLAAAFAILLYYVSTLLLSPKTKGRTRVPEARGALPLIGHVHLLGGPVPPHLVLGEMADRHGPVFAIRMGVYKALVVNSWAIAKECLTTHDRAIASRSKSVAAEVMAYNYAMLGFSPYGPHWRQMRRIVMVEVMSSHRLGLLRHVRESEVRASIRGIYNQWKEKKPLVEMRKAFGDIVLNIVLRMIVGKRYEDEKDEKGRAALRITVEVLGRFLISDALPFLRWLDVGGHEKVMRDTARKLDRMVQGWLDEHRRQRKLEGSEKGEDEQDFMDIIISTIDGEGGGDLPKFDADTVIKATCMALVLAASDTTMVTLTWALSLLLNHKEALNKAQQEIDTAIGKDRQMTEDDLKNLPYIQAIIKETLRLYPAAPLAIPHESMEACTINGYHVDKGTRIIFNLPKIQRDVKVWENPNDFRPERFLTTHKDIDVRGKNFELIPFGSGRRICVGISMALQVIGLSLASLLHGFEVATPGNQPIDMTEAIGLSNLKATPLEVLVAPRLHEHLYDL